MDEKRPKRRKDKYNPYTISRQGSRYFLSFKDGQGVSHNYPFIKHIPIAIVMSMSHVSGCAMML